MVTQPLHIVLIVLHTQVQIGGWSLLPQIGQTPGLSQKREVCIKELLAEYQDKSMLSEGQAEDHGNCNKQVHKACELINCVAY